MEQCLKFLFFLGAFTMLTATKEESVTSEYDEFDLNNDRNICTISRDAVSNLSQSIMEFNKDRFSDFYYNNDANETDENCDGMFQQIESGYKLLRTEFLNLTNIVDATECVKSVSILKSEVDSLKLTNKKLTEKVSDVKLYKEKLLDYFKLLLELQRDAELTEILNLYYANDVKNVKTIIFYIRNYFTIDYNMIAAFDRLYMVMDNHHDLCTDEALMLKANLLDTLTYSGSSSNAWSWIIGDSDVVWHNFAMGLVSLLNEHTGKILEQWKSDILEENFDHIKQICADYPNVPKYLMKELVELTYKSDKEVIKKILKFADYLDDDVLTIWIYGELLDHMMRNQYLDVLEMFVLANRIKTIKAKADLSHLHQSDSEYLDLIVASLPSPINSFLWGSVCFKNIKESQYLAALGEVSNESIRSVELSENCNASWTIDVLDDGAKFRIKNVVKGEYLFAGDDKHAKDSERRRVFTWVGANLTFCDGEDEWIFEPFQNCDLFYVKNVKYGEYLFSDPLRMNMVYTFRDKEHMVKNSLWTFSSFNRWGRFFG